MKFLKNFVIGLLILSLPLAVLAETDWLNQMPDYMGSAPDANSFDIFDFINKLINWLFYALLVVALVMILMVAYTYITAGGEATKASKAGKNLGFILLGIAIALLAKGLIYLTCVIVGSSEICTFNFK